MKRNALGWFLSLAAGLGLVTVTPLFSQQKGDEPGRVNANKQVEPVNNQGQPRNFNDQLRAEGVQAAGQGGQAGQPGRGGVVINRRAPGSGGRTSYNETMQQQLDSDIAECLILENQNEVALAKLAASKTQNDDVKKFADMLEKDHSQMISKLQKFAGHQYSDRDTSRDANWTTSAGNAGNAGGNVRQEIRQDNRETRENIREDRRENREKKTEDRAEARNNNANQNAAGNQNANNQNANNQNANNQNTNQPAAGVRVQENNAGGQNNHASELISIHHQMKHEEADQCLADARKELSSKQSNEFDECFVGMQIAGHMKMDSQLKVVRRHASSNLEQIISSGQQTTEEHLKEAKSLIQKLTKSDRSSDKSDRSSDKNDKNDKSSNK